MSSKVTAKLPLGAAFSVLLISLALLAGCKQEAPVDNSYTPPGYGASVGYLTDTVWKNDSDTIRFGAEGKVTTVPDSWKKELSVKILTSNNWYRTVQADFNDFTYSGGVIYGKVTKVGEGSSEYLEKGDRVKVATFDVPTATTNTNYSGQSNTVTNYYAMKVTIAGATTSTTFTMENKPTSGDKFVGTYYDELGRKKIQINKDGTFVAFTNGGQFIQRWEYNDNGTNDNGIISVTPFTNNSAGSSASTSSTTYYLYPHALMTYNSYMSEYTAVAWK